MSIDTMLGSPAGPGRVLIVEDDDDMRMLERVWLERAGWEVCEATDGAAGISLARTALPEVIICERRLPDRDGIDIVVRLAQDPLTAPIPVVLVSSIGDAKDLVAALDAGAHDYLVKPFEMVELEARCRAASRVGRAHQQLSESERELRLLADNVSELVTRCGMDGVIRYASPSAWRKLGLEPAELVGRHFSTLFHPDDPRPTSPAQLTAADDVVTVTRRIRRADGTFIWVETRARVVVGPMGDLEILSAARDVTERVATAAALAESEARYRRIVDLAAEGILTVDSDQVITYANERMAEMLRTTASVLVGRSALEFMDDEGRALAAERIARRRAGIGESGDFKFVRADGTPVWTSLNAAPVRDDDGTIRGSIALVADVTDRHHNEDALAQSEARYRALLDHLPDTVAIVYDRQLRAVLAAGGGLASRGLAANDMVGKRFSELVAPQDADVLESLYRAAFAGESTTTEFLSQLTGVENLLDVLAVPGPGDAAPAEILVVARNIGPLKDRERLLTAAEQRWRTAFEHAPVGMAEVGVDGRFQSVNPALCDLLGYSAKELRAMTPGGLNHPDDADRTRKTLAILAGQPTEDFRSEKRFIHALGHVVWVALSAAPIRDAEGRIDHFLTHYLDISDLKRAEAELQSLAASDPLSGLLNRRGFEAALDRHIAHVNRYGPDGALIMIDLDGLKRVNDTLGHDAGDQIIVAVADALRRRLRTSDTIARLGGDEFAVLVPHTDRAGVKLVAAAIVVCIREACSTLKGLGQHAVTASVGAAVFDRTAESAERVLGRADTAMYRTKRAGGDRYALSAAPRDRRSPISAGRGRGPKRGRGPVSLVAGRKRPVA